jgi:hypothetical protein
MATFRGEIFKAVKIEGVGLSDKYQQGLGVLGIFLDRDTREETQTRFWPEPACQL